MENLKLKEEEQIWGILTINTPLAFPSTTGRFAPMTTQQWRAVFRQWVTEYAHWFSIEGPPTPRMPIVIHRPIKGNDCIEVILLIARVIRRGGAVDLDDPLLYTIWLDFLNDHEVRKSHWESWKKDHTEVRFL